MQTLSKSDSENKNKFIISKSNFVVLFHNIYLKDRIPIVVIRVRKQARYNYQIKKWVVDNYAANESTLTIVRSLGLPYGTVAN